MLVVQAGEALPKGKSGALKEVNIERDSKAAQDLVKKTGQMGVPVIKIGSRWIVGFDQPRIERELARLS